MQNLTQQISKASSEHFKPGTRAASSTNMIDLCLGGGLIYYLKIPLKYLNIFINKLTFLEGLRKMSVQCLQGKDGRDLVGTLFCNKEENISRLYASMKVVGKLCQRI